MKLLHNSKTLEIKDWYVYVASTLVVLTPLLKHGYVLSLDLVFTPKIHMPTNISNTYILEIILHEISFILPSDDIEKIILALILFLSGFGMHKLQKYIYRNNPDINQTLSCYFAGILYMINPFTYDRFMAGQYEVLLGYCLLPWFVISLLKFVHSPSLSRVITLTIWSVVISIVSVHAIGFIFLLAAVALGLNIWKQRKDMPWVKKTLRFSAISATIFLIASSYWLLPLALGYGSTATTIDSFTTSDQAAFQTVGGNAIGKFGSVISLQGFWGEDRGLYILPQDKVGSIWYLLSLILLALVIVGGVRYWKRGQRFIVVFFGFSALIAAILAIGIFNGWMARFVPFFSGYREPEKFVALVALTFAVFSGRGIGAMLDTVRKWGKRSTVIIVSVLVLLFPFAWTPTMLCGFDHQLTAVEYPADWYSANSYLDADHSSFNVLFLPWHLYMYYIFADRIIASPAPQFFDKPIISSNDPEFGGISPPKNQVDTYVSSILASGNHVSDLGSLLVREHIKYILLSRDDDFMTYGYLNRQSDLKLVRSGPTLDIYKNEDFR